jgi:hypothetical protein
MKQRFGTRKNGSALVGVSAGFAILFVSVGLPLLLDGFHWGLFFPLAIGLFMLFVLTASVMKFFISFTVSEQGFEISLPPFHHTRITGNQIRSVRALDPDESKALFDASIREMFALGDNADTTGFVRLIRKRSPAYRYLSVAPAAAVSTTGRREQLASLKVFSRQRMVVLTLQDGKELYLSPADIDGFVRSLERFLPRPASV